jgi:divalent metal cation (Fe/Co/Zn/Cd) transporter
MMFRRKSTVDRLAEEVKDTSPVVRGVIVAFAVAGLLALTYLARRNLWRALAIFADAVEEVADTVEDAAEDVRDAARARAESG